MMAQELRNPFAPIRVAAAMLGRRADLALLPRAQALIEQQVDQMSRLVDGLLGPDKSRLTRGHRLFDLAATVADVARACQPAMDRRLQTLDIDIAAAPLEARGDPLLIAQVLTNLLSNATTYIGRR